MSRIIAIGLFLAVVVVCAAGIILASERFDAAPFQEAAAEAAPPEQPLPSRAEQVMYALAEAYPRVEKAEFRNDDWAVLMEDCWYYYAGGRLLPEELLDKTAGYSSIAFYNYQSELPPWTEPSPEQTARFRSWDTTAARPAAAPRTQRSTHFFDALYQARTHAESSQRVKAVRFLGTTVTVHSAIAEILSLVEKRIMAAAETDPLVQSWVTGIGEMHGWNWRNVAGSQSRSYHSYGIAVDILPKSLGGKETYWQWAAQRGREWWNIPYEDRYHPPDAVIKAFESYGFVWGGKWPYFDTMHFEYRPEVFIMGGMELLTP